MQKWEYLEVFLDYYHKEWHDSMGRQGELERGAAVGYPKQVTWGHSGTLLNALGQQGWELAGVEAYPDMRGGHTERTGAYSAKWLFKRPCAP